MPSSRQLLSAAVKNDLFQTLIVTLSIETVQTPLNHSKTPLASVKIGITSIRDLSIYIIEHVVCLEQAL
jgi:hypothetical protein